MKSPPMIGAAATEIPSCTGKRFVYRMSIMWRCCANAAVAAILFGLPAHAETVRLHVILNSISEVPPIASSGTGRGQFTYDTESKQFTYAVVYDALTGPAIAAHIHGPALPGANAGVVVDMLVPTSPMRGTATLSDAQAAELLAGHYYVNVHTDENKSGEIRGQITRDGD